MTTRFSKNVLSAGNSAGVSVFELLVVVAIVAIISAVSIVRFQPATRSLKLAGATRDLSTLLEKARADSVQRHGGASMVLNDRYGYTANIDFNRVGSATARNIALPLETTLRYSLPPATTSIDPAVTPLTINFDWRGRTTQTVLITLTDSTLNNFSSSVMVGPAGDLSTDTSVSGPAITPTPQNRVVTPTTGIKGMP